MLHPSRMGHDLLVFLLGYTNNLSILIENDKTSTTDILQILRRIYRVVPWSIAAQYIKSKNLVKIVNDKNLTDISNHWDNTYLVFC